MICESEIMADKNEIDATTEVMKLCNVCEKDTCLQPCGAARTMLLAFNLEYKG